MNLADPEREVNPSSDQAIQLFTAGRDLPCPHCRYNLRDLARARCPECGGPLQLTLRQPAFSCFRKPLLIIFGVLLALNVAGAWYQWTSTSASRSTFVMMRTQYSRGLGVLDTQMQTLVRERAAAAFDYEKLRSDENRNRLELVNKNIADCQLAHKQIEIAFRSIPSPVWFTLKWWKTNPAREQPHALFVLGAIVSAFALAILLVWRRSARLATVWMCMAAIVTANGVFGLALLLK